MGSNWKNRYEHLETRVGAGYYALREGTKGRTKLVKADRSPSGTPYCAVFEKRKPSVGHNLRRVIMLEKRGL